ncbi:MAG TPA: polyamine aminopropyltransferase [Dissulfurispiraceae bacterium]|nr:polyamine aminopropyltransferase [Dissulfurispiraceae bacterium]
MLHSRWFLEQTTDDEGAFHSLREILYSGRSPFQRIEIIRTGSYGKCLVLDGKMQSSEADEFIYHEALVHPALVLHGSPARVLVAGGGEGASVREVLRHPRVRSVVMVDLDREAVEVCRQYLTDWHQGALNDSRVTIVYDDARKYIETAAGFDVIIIDLPEPFDEGPALMLYTREFYEMVSRSLAEGGVMVTQATSTAVHNLRTFATITHTISQVFPVVRPYTVNVPSFFTPWGFVLASGDKDPLLLSREEISQRLEGIGDNLRFYDAETHTGMLALPKYLRSAIEREEQVITDSAPLSFY